MLLYFQMTHSKNEGRLGAECRGKYNVMHGYPPEAGILRKGLQVPPRTPSRCIPARPQPLCSSVLEHSLLWSALPLGGHGSPPGGGGMSARVLMRPIAPVVPPSPSRPRARSQVSEVRRPRRRHSGRHPGRARDGRRGVDRRTTSPYGTNRGLAHDIRRPNDKQGW